MKNVACIIARTNSTRLPQKVLKEVNGVKLIEYLVRKVKKARNIDVIYICTSVDEDDRILLEIAKQNGVNCYAGSRDSVIDRMLEVARIEDADNVIRITGDNIFTDEGYLDLMLYYHSKNDAEYTRTENLPLGVTAEIINVKTLKKVYSRMNPSVSQYLAMYIFQPDNYKCLVLLPEQKHNNPNMTLTVDTPEDFTRTLQLISKSNHLINVDDIINICLTTDIKHIYYQPGAAVKFPENITFSYKAYRVEMECRTEKSLKVQLLEGEYEETLKAQHND